MRPRHKAAENREVADPHAREGHASMRPRHKAAENAQLPALPDGWARMASMRPRHKAAENRHRHPLPGARSPGFNEAAA